MKITRQGAVDEDGNLLDEDGEIKERYDPDKKLNIIHVFYWYNDLQGRLKQELRPPALYHGNPRMFVKESVEKLGENELITHLRVYYGRKLLAELNIPTREYVEGYYSKFTDDSREYREDNDIRFEIRTKVNHLLNGGGWKLYPIKKLLRKGKKSKPKTRKPISKPVKKVKKVVRKKTVVKKRK
jgi:hypothetical protein